MNGMEWAEEMNDLRDGDSSATGGSNNKEKERRSLWEMNTPVEAALMLAGGRRGNINGEGIMRWSGTKGPKRVNS
jgi:hypothetical protein